MDLAFMPEDLRFQDEVRAFVADNLAKETVEKNRRGLKLEKHDYVNWQKALARKGWIAPNWPVQHGGVEFSQAQSYIFETECARGWAPRIMTFGLKYCAPVIIAFGNAAQKQRFLPPIRESDEWWCQGYSEPGSGSDLASLRTRAERQGDHYIVNGQKTWTTLAQWADWIFCLVRTDPKAKAQEGISFLLIDMKSPGVEVQPIITMDGAHEVNSVFFTDVKVPVENLVGEENKGWTYAKFLLGHERSGTSGVARSKAQIGRLRQIAAAEVEGGEPLIGRKHFRDKLAEVEIELTSLEYTELRYVVARPKGEAPGPEVSHLKTVGTSIQQRISELLMEAIGYYAQPWQPEALQYGWNGEPVGPEYGPSLAPTYFNLRKTSIYGGSNEIQRNILAKMVLGL
jgi:alkylation response protein AidB-like acyl-CoA dehydrogenase